MPTVINLFSIRVNSISNNGSVNIGEAMHNSHVSSSKATGSNTSFGDLSPTESLMENIYIDPDTNDQANIGNLDEVVTTQT
ncbi:spore germination protein [Metabacillus sp. GX 13764]|uniref:spore germination protein n=1 Tax=Metabacillus kandeliae TaxID=2900151 RepID=UPI001E32CCCE|nr:spore germination protein [Metabacillus kandeliae]MCD7036211.1 spore germination protein [Metabacillus kandeliae]